MKYDLNAGKAGIFIEQDERAMGERTAGIVAKEMMEAAGRGQKTVLWLMAAPSAFPFYKSFVDLCRGDESLAAQAGRTYFFQFDDYPIGRDDVKFPITFRSLLETYFFKPLSDVCGNLGHIELMELTGGADDSRIAEAYAARVLELLNSSEYHVIEIKGIGMDGHWAFMGQKLRLIRRPGSSRFR